MPAPNAFNAGEAQDIRERLRELEDETATALSRMSVHEQKCSSRYQLLILLVCTSMTLEIGRSFGFSLPQILSLIGGL